MPADKLTQKQETFCQAYVRIGEESAAYRSAYDTSRMKPETVWSCACRLMKNPKVIARIEEIKRPILDKVIEEYEVTLVSHIKRLKELGKKAEADGQYSAAINAETQCGKAVGLYDNKTHLDGRVEFVWKGNANRDSV